MAVLRYPRVVLSMGLVAALCVVTLTASQRQAAAMATAANAFLTSLTPEERQQAVLPFDGEERMRWNFIPNEMFPRKGLMVKSMTDQQRGLAHALLKTGLSQRGYMTATSIMDLENVLRAIEAVGGGDGRRFARDPLEYYFTVFGTPGSTGAWGWRVDGHHVSLHFTVEDGKAVACSPTFFGSNPAKVLEGPKAGPAHPRAAGRRRPRPDQGARREAADGRDHRGRGAERDRDRQQARRRPAEPRRNRCRRHDAAAARAADEAGRRLHGVHDGGRCRRAALEDQAGGLDKITFAWAGRVEPGKKHYYRVQGPTFLIEFDNVQNNGNHIHSVWRDFQGDFGRDLLREHLAAYPH